MKIKVLFVVLVLRFCPKTQEKFQNVNQETTLIKSKSECRIRVDRNYIQFLMNVCHTEARGGPNLVVRQLNMTLTHITEKYPDP